MGEAAVEQQRMDTGLITERLSHTDISRIAAPHASIAAGEGGFFIGKIQ